MADSGSPAIARGMLQAKRWQDLACSLYMILKTGRCLMKMITTAFLTFCKSRNKSRRKTNNHFWFILKLCFLLRHEVAVVVEKCGGGVAVTLPCHVSAYSSAVWNWTCKRIDALRPHSETLPLGLGAWSTWEHGSLPPLAVFQLSPVFGLSLFFICFVFHCFALLGWLMSESWWGGMPWSTLPALALLLRAAPRHQLCQA